MTPLRLRSPTAPFPPGGFGFVDQRTGMVFDGMEGNADMQAQRIIKHRLANRRLYPEAQYFDKGFVKQEVFAVLYARHPELFLGGAQQPPQAQVSPVVQQAVPAATTSRPCPKCGSFEAVAIMCATCGSGSKVTGYKCLKCGSRRGK